MKHDLNDIAGKLAASLRDVVNETSESYLKQDPEEAFVDMACRLVLALAKENLTICPQPTVEERIQVAHAEGAARIFDIFDKWILGGPGRTCVTGVGPFDRIEVVAREAGVTKLFFQGETVQDAYAQAAQTILFNEGSL